MAITDLVPWSRNRNMSASRQGEEHPFFALLREMDRMFDKFFRGFDWPISTTPGWSVGGWPPLWPIELSNPEWNGLLLPEIDQTSFAPVIAA